MLDVRRLRILREVAARGSFSAAATALAYTQPAVSQQIAALEREAGTRLVERGARGVRLTAAGRALVGHADAVMAQLEEAERDLAAIAGLRGGALSMAAFPSVAATLVPPAVAAFRARHPGVELSLRPLEPSEAVTALRAGEVDVAMVLEIEARPFAGEGLCVQPVFDDPMYVALPGDHPLAKLRSVPLERLADEAWVLGTVSASCPDTELLRGACVASGFEPRLAFHCDDYPAIQGFVAAGVGVSLIPDLALVSVREDLAIRRLSGPAPVRRVLAATREQAGESPAADAMVGFLVEAGRDWASRRRTLRLVG